MFCVFLNHTGQRTLRKSYGTSGTATLKECITIQNSYPNINGSEMTKISSFSGNNNISYNKMHCSKGLANLFRLNLSYSCCE